MIAPKQITSNLWQGDSDPVYEDKLPEGVTTVIAVGNGFHKLPHIQVSKHIPLIEFLPNWEVIRANGVYLRLSTEEEVIAAIEAVHNAIRKGWTVYLHCDAGVCRSVGIAAGYLVRSGQYSDLFEAHKFVYGGDGGLGNGRNPFEVTLINVIERKYWTQFEKYTDILNNW